METELSELYSLLQSRGRHTKVANERGGNTHLEGVYPLQPSFGSSLRLPHEENDAEEEQEEEDLLLLMEKTGPLPFHNTVDIGDVHDVSNARSSASFSIQNTKKKRREKGNNKRSHLPRLATSEKGAAGENEENDDVKLVTVSQLQPPLEEFLRSLLQPSMDSGSNKDKHIEKTIHNATENWIDALSKEQGGARKLLSLLETKGLMDHKQHNVRARSLSRAKREPAARTTTAGHKSLLSNKIIQVTTRQQPQSQQSTVMRVLSSSAPLDKTNSTEISKLLEDLRSHTTVAVEAGLGELPKSDTFWELETLEKERRRHEESIWKDKLSLDNQIQVK